MTTDEIMALADAAATEMIHGHYHPFKEKREALRQAIEALAKDAAPVWMPIETAPKRDEIDIWSCGYRIAGCVFGKPTYGKTIGWIYESHHDCDGLVYELVSSPTHWMALPKPPAIEAAQAEQA